MQNWLVFTDLDGTLMDERTYSMEAASGALQFLKERNVPVIPCTSKTASEVREVLREIDQNHPFIVENGSAIVYPPGYFGNDEPAADKESGYCYITLGYPYGRILEFFDELKALYGLPARGMSEMDTAEIIRHTGLSEAEAVVARNRQFSEPFVLLEPDFDLTAVLSHVHKKGFRMLIGNRFYHLLGASDKGNAVRHMVKIYKDHLFEGPVQTIGIGDSRNDLEMLQAVDFPVMVRKHTGKHLEEIEVPGLLRTDGIGPAGWQEAIFYLLKNRINQEK